MEEDRALIPLPDDLVNGLESLSFEKVFEENKMTYINKLRYSCQIINVSICVYTMYFINTLDAIKKATILKELNKSKCSKIYEENIPGVYIGMIGCGTLGHEIVRWLMYKNNIQPCQLVISTRTPEQLDEFKSLGISCTDDNLKAYQFAEVLLLAIPPAQLSLLSKEIREHLPKECLVYSLLAGQDLQKLASILGTDNVYNLSISFNENTTVKLKWKSTNRMSEILSDQEILNKFLPFKDSDLIIGVNKLPAIMMCAAVNLCFAVSSQSSEEILSLVQSVIFSKLPMVEEERFWIEDFDQGFSSRQVVSVLKSKSNVATMAKKVNNSSDLQEGFCKVFIQHCYVPIPKKETEWDNIKRSLTLD